LGPSHRSKRAAFKLARCTIVRVAVAAVASIIAAIVAAVIITTIIVAIIAATIDTLAKHGVKVSAVKDAPESYNATPSDRPHHNKPSTEAQIGSLGKGGLRVEW